MLTKNTTPSLNEPAKMNLVVRIENGYLPSENVGMFNGICISPPAMMDRRLNVRLVLNRSIHALDDLSSFAVQDQTVLFHECSPYPQEPGDAVGRWLAKTGEVFGARPGREAVHGLCRVIVKRGESGQRPQAQVDILRTDQAMLIRSLEDLRHFFETYMRAEIGMRENNANSILRLIEPGAKKRIVTMWVYVARETIRLPAVAGSPPKSFNIPASLDRTWNDAITMGLQSKGLARVVAAALGESVKGLSAVDRNIADELRAKLMGDKVLIEAIPGQRIRVLGDSLESLMTPGSRLAKAASRGLMVDKHGADIAGFMPMTVELMISPPKGDHDQYLTAVVTKFIPDIDAQPCGGDEIKTGNYPFQDGVNPFVGHDRA